MFLITDVLNSKWKLGSGNLIKQPTSLDFSDSGEAVGILSLHRCYWAEFDLALPLPSLLVSVQYMYVVGTDKTDSMMLRFLKDANLALLSLSREREFV